jgi:hypothetical protein
VAKMGIDNSKLLVAKIDLLIKVLFVYISIKDFQNMNKSDQIRELKSRGFRSMEIEELYGITSQHVSTVVRRSKSKSRRK